MTTFSTAAFHRTIFPIDLLLRWFRRKLKSSGARHRSIGSFPCVVMVTSYQSSPIWFACSHGSFHNRITTLFPLDQWWSTLNTRNSKKYSLSSRRKNTFQMSIIPTTPCLLSLLISRTVHYLKDPSLIIYKYLFPDSVFVVLYLNNITYRPMQILFSYSNNLKSHWSQCYADKCVSTSIRSSSVSSSFNMAHLVKIHP
jgi:hypothetical protein